jgi:hypothetical protein
MHNHHNFLVLSMRKNIYLVLLISIIEIFTLLVEKNIILTSPFNRDKRISEIVILSSC